MSSAVATRTPDLQSSLNTGLETEPSPTSSTSIDSMEVDEGTQANIPQYALKRRGGICVVDNSVQDFLDGREAEN
ncbi:hypothetical protein K7432_002708 [Basidiobolus ranarum]|uniref:Uncharacterized protein n=1 Tax=Basidiobolus ranarum TaxID=34480 RepID=A0ABR2X156_9FUNG